MYEKYRYEEVGERMIERNCVFDWFVTWIDWWIKWMDERSEWMNEWVNQRMNAWMKEQSKESVKEQPKIVNQWMKKWMDDSIWIRNKLFKGIQGQLQSVQRIIYLKTRVECLSNSTQKMQKTKR